MAKRYCVVWSVVILLASSVNADVDLGSRRVTIRRLDGKLRVEIGGKLFTEYVYQGQGKPILYPIVGPTGAAITRNYPMKPEVKGEANDHPHHRSLWFSHGLVNGTDFWHEGKETGKQLQEAILEVESGTERGRIKTKNRWVKKDGTIVCTDERELTFFEVEGGRVIDVKVTVHASHGEIVFGDTKEGTMGIRTHPLMRLRKDERRGVFVVKGKAINSRGHKNGELWGKRAEWVDYWAPSEGQTTGIAIFDHPKNPRHPTWWHARDYGLIGANPFGVHDFEGKKAGTGDLKVATGTSRVFRYRFYFHRGDSRAAKTAKLYAEFARAESGAK
ncbi:MAG: PmoA family protein [Planctomycetota bacterium]